MKITTYKQDGSLISVKEEEIVMPDYLKDFDNSYPLFRLSEYEHSLILSKESLPKSLLLDKISVLFDYDFTLYGKKFEQGLCKDDVNIFNLTGEESFDTIFDGIIKEAILQLLPEDDSFIVPMFPLLKDSVHIPCADFKNALHKSLIELKEQYECYYNKFKNNGVSIAVAFIIIRLAKQSADSLNGIWYDITRKYPTKSFPNDVLKEISAPFDILSGIQVNPASAQMDFCERFYKELHSRLINHLVESQGIGRSRYYHVIRLMDEMLASLAKVRTSSVMAYMSPTYQPMPNCNYDFKLYNTAKRGYKVLTLTDEEITSILDNVQELNGIREALIEISKDYNAFNGKDCREWVDKMYEGFLYRNKGNNVNWLQYEEEYNSSKLHLNTNPRYKVQESYEETVALSNTLGPKVDVTFTDEMIKHLLLILKVNYNKVDTDQDGLYETLYQFNYIKSKIKDVSYTPDDALEDAMRFLTPVLSDPNMLNCNEAFNIKGKVRSILEIGCIKKELNQKMPTGRTSYIGRFNLKIVLNVLGVFVNLEKIKGNKKSDIERMIQQSSLLNSQSGEWRKYITYKGKDSCITTIQLKAIKEKLSTLGIKANMI